MGRDVWSKKYTLSLDQTSTMAYKKLKLWFDKELAELLSKKIEAVTNGFDSASFIEAVDKGVQPLELKARVELIADELHRHLSPDYSHNIQVLMKIVGPENEEETGMFTNFYWLMPMAKYIEKYGLDDFDLSVEAMLEVTKRHTSEYTIRPFLEKYPNKMYSLLMEWVKDPNSHVRRLASEGIRPRLPWAPALKQYIADPRPILPILEALKNDSSKYVQKSVANCLNDILKDNFEIGKSLIDDWSVHPTKERKWIVKHALRNFLKKENEWAKGVVIAMAS